MTNWRGKKWEPAEHTTRFLVKPWKRIAQRHKITLQKQSATAWHNEEKNTLCFRWQGFKSVLLSLSAAIQPLKVSSYESTSHQKSTTDSPYVSHLESHFPSRKRSIHESSKPANIINNHGSSNTFSTPDHDQNFHLHLSTISETGSKTRSRSSLWCGNATQSPTKNYRTKHCCISSRQQWVFEHKL